MSSFGRWTDEGGLPAFVYMADQYALPAAVWDPLVSPATRRHWVAVGNRRIQAVVDNDGGIGLWDTADGLRWITAPDPRGTGFSTVHTDTGQVLNSRYAPGDLSARVVGPTWFSVRASRDGLSLDRTVHCLDGEHPWVLVEVRLAAAADGGPRTVRHVEAWDLRPRFCNLRTGRDRSEVTSQAVRWTVQEREHGLRLHQVFTDAATDLRSGDYPALFGQPHVVVLECLAGAAVTSTCDTSTPHEPSLELVTQLTLVPGESQTLWFRFGLDQGAVPPDPSVAVAASAASLSRRLPRAQSPRAHFVEREVPWHAALLTGGACVDAVLGGHTLDQGSVYSFGVGINGAARDPLQHALPLVYSEPDLALSVLRNTCAWATPDGDLPYALDGRKQPWTSVWHPSDGNLWAMWLAAEYAAATGDLAAFDRSLDYHGDHPRASASLGEHLRRQFRFFVDEIGLGAHGHVRMRNADWNDTLLHECGEDPLAMIASGESVLNSAMAAWVLPVYAGLCERLGDLTTAAEARKLGEQLRAAVTEEWNGRWFRRAYGPGRGPIGEDDLWLEVQPWAILCGAADPARSRELLATIDERLRADSPLGARVRWPVDDRMNPGCPGEGTGGGIWASIAMTLVWAAARVDPDLAWDEFRRLSLDAHTAAYPDVWEGTLSGPDCFNGPESARPGRTWALPRHRVAMQSFPVNNLHSHAQPLLSYLRLLGVEPTSDGALRVGGGGTFASSTFTLKSDGSGVLWADGPIVLETLRGTVRGGAGQVAWP